VERARKTSVLDGDLHSALDSLKEFAGCDLAIRKPVATASSSTN
jgi:hypothetical protein